MQSRHEKTVKLLSALKHTAILTPNSESESGFFASSIKSVRKGLKEMQIKSVHELIISIILEFLLT